MPPSERTGSEPASDNQTERPRHDRQYMLRVMQQVRRVGALVRKKIERKLALKKLLLDAQGSARPRKMTLGAKPIPVGALRQLTWTELAEVIEINERK